MSDLQDLFNIYTRTPRFNLDHIQKAFADASLSFNFIFMNKQAIYLFGANMREQSEDVFPVFAAIAKSTGGLFFNAQNTSVSFSRAADASKKCYILYCQPSGVGTPGRFRKLEVKIKGQPYDVLHRSGYFSQ